mmetsp:Transcript_8682/g.19005  ORF Transcript_8682/g.19005 Transcript_8682/m.19005 type:complete len:194 (-) Transcript_8682:202-783(-)
MFAEHLGECRLLAAQASGEVAKLRAAPERERASLSAAAFSLLKQADEGLASLQLEARSAPAEERRKLCREEEALRAELRATAKELNDARREMLLGTGAAEDAGGDTERLFLAREERRRTSAVTDSLRKGHDRLQEARKQAAETEHIGVETLQELRRQRETIHRVKDHTADLGHNLRDAERTVKSMEQPSCVAM